jgi:endonuclease-3
MKAPAEGIIVDLHTIRVANRLGIVDTENADKIEKEMMEILPKNEWDAGMAISFLGREICRPKPECPICLMKPVCKYYNTVIKFHPDIIDQKAVEKKTAIKKASSKK